MDKNAYFIKTSKCPVCGSNVDSIAIKSNSTRLEKSDEDFCPHYKPINTLLYNVWICSECGYAAMSDKFENILDSNIKIVRNNISKKWTKRDFSGERTLEVGLEIYKIALLNLQVVNAKASEFAKVCMRIAWLYRMKNDKNEEKFLKYALDNYIKMYQKEKFPVDKMDERTCMYMIGELHRRLGNSEEGAKWFYNVISYRDDTPESKTRHIVDMARDQLQTIKDIK